MSHQHGAYLGGIRTIEDLRQRCRIDPATGCWHWGLAKSGGCPYVYVKLPHETLPVNARRGRRAALCLVRGDDLPPGFIAYPTDDCHSDDCVNPEHATAGRRWLHGRHMRRTGRARTPAKSIASALTALRAGAIGTKVPARSAFDLARTL